MSKPILCVDFDGVVHSYTSGWKGADVVADSPVPGALQWLRAATEFFDVRIYSSRSKDPRGLDAMRSWMFNFALHIWGDSDVVARFMASITFCAEKPAAFLTIDDRCITFQGDWSALDPRELLKFTPWNKKDLVLRTKAAP